MKPQACGNIDKINNPLARLTVQQKKKEQMQVTNTKNKRQLITSNLTNIKKYNKGML